MQVLGLVLKLEVRGLQPVRQRYTRWWLFRSPLANSYEQQTHTTWELPAGGLVPCARSSEEPDFLGLRENDFTDLVAGSGISHMGLYRRSQRFVQRASHTPRIVV